jgi:hypothetical protein
MSLPLFLHGLGSIGIFASRAFLPAFVTAMLLRFGFRIPWLAQAGLLPHVRDVPTWFTSDASLVVLGLLTALELVAERVPEAKGVLDEVHTYLKTGMAALTFLGVLGATDRAVVGGMIHPASVGETLPALAVAAGTFVASKVLGAVVGPLVETDEDDDLGLQGLLRWVGDLWGALGPVALILMPLLTVAALGMALGLLGLTGWYVERREEAALIPCATCGQMIHGCATICPHCRAPVKEPRAVGPLGNSRARPADPATHPFRLIAVKRCPACATRFGRRAVKQTCAACGYPLMDDPRFAEQYIRFIDRRVPSACAASFLLGLIPVLGVIPGVIVYRLAIVAPFRLYIPPGHGLLLRWGVRLALVILVALQWVPVAGGFALPAMALINYAAYRSVYRKLALSS